MRQITVGYTIYNKKGLASYVVKGIKECFPDDEIIFLFDACTDGSQKEYKRLLEGLDVKYIEPEEELFEVKANNRILKEATNDVIILFQDDMVCQDPLIKNKIFEITDFYDRDLGLMGGRDGFEIEDLSFPEKAVNKISSWTHHPKGVEMLEAWGAAERTILNRGPLVFTKRLLKQVGYLDEAFYPLWGDEMDYCCRAKFEHGLKNIVFECNIKSLLEWGSTRKGTKLKKQLPTIMRKNWELLVSRWGPRLLEKDDKR